MISMNSKPGMSMLPESTAVMQQVSRQLEQIPEIDYEASVTGYSFTGSGPSMGMYFLSCAQALGRTAGGRAVSFGYCERIYALSPEIPDAQMFVLTPPMIPGYGMGNGFELYVQDRFPVI